MKLPILNNLKKKDKPELTEALKKTFSPSKGSLAKGKKSFLAAFDVSPLSHTPTPRASAFSWGLKFGIGVLAVFAVVASTSAYADTANVSVDSPLYPLKRLGENVQLALTPSSQKAQVEATFAVRRAAEIDHLERTHPSSTLIGSLVGDLNTDVSSSLSASSGTSRTARPLSDLCTVLSGRLGSSLSVHTELLARFDARCGTSVGVASSGTDITASSSAVSGPFLRAGESLPSSTASTTRHSHNGRGIFHGVINASSSSTIKPPAIPVIPSVPPVTSKLPL